MFTKEKLELARRAAVEWAVEVLECQGTSLDHPLVIEKGGRLGFARHLPQIPLRVLNEPEEALRRIEGLLPRVSKSTWMNESRLDRLTKDLKRARRALDSGAFYSPVDQIRVDAAEVAAIEAERCARTIVGGASIEDAARAFQRAVSLRDAHLRLAARLSAQKGGIFGKLREDELKGRIVLLEQQVSDERARVEERAAKVAAIKAWAEGVD